MLDNIPMERRTFCDLVGFLFNKLSGEIHQRNKTFTESELISIFEDKTIPDNVLKYIHVTNYSHDGISHSYNYITLFSYDRKKNTDKS